MSGPLRTVARRMSTEAVSFRSSLLKTPETQVTTLSNGFRVATQKSPHQTATVGLYIDAGSRFETAENNGTAHFLEHMAFKGTNKRSQLQLELEVENMGAMLNAYTSREQTVYYAKCFDKDVAHATEILSDLLTNCTLSPDAIEAERSVILREMTEVNDNKEELVLDLVHTTAFQGSSLGYTILGPKENIKSISREDLQNYISTNYTGPRMVLAAAGGVDHDELVKVAEDLFSGLPAQSSAPEMTAPGFVGSDLRARDDTLPQAHIALAVEGCSWSNPDYFPLLVASTMVGSWDRSFAGGANMSSKLAQRCTEHNAAHSYTSFHTSYSDTGIWGLFGVCDRESVDDFIWAVQEEWRHVCMHATDADVERAKNQMRAAALYYNDGTTPICEEIGRQLQTYGRRMYPAEYDARVQAVTKETLRDIASKYLYDQCPVVVGVGPIEQIPDYNRIRSNMWSMAS